MDRQPALADPGSFRSVDDGLTTRDPLGFPGYGSPERESVLAGAATIGGIDVELAEFDFGVMGGSMGEVAGERIARSLERAAERTVPFVLRTATGGARMQEGMRSLIQMPKMVAARRSLTDAHVPFVAVLAHPTTGGVLASIAALADLIAAESDATVGFAGPRVAQAFTSEPLPAHSHTAGSAFAHGLVDEIVTAGDAPSFVAQVLRCLAPDEPVEPAGLPAGEPEPVAPWDAVAAVRDPSRPRARALMEGMTDLAVEMRGDRAGSDDPALAAVLGRVRGRRCVLLGLDHEHHPGPGAYRKARRCMAAAERLGIPVVTLIDTRGADPSAPSEARGIAWEIAATFDALLDLDVPVVSVVTGEGGSGGALALAAADRLVALSDSIFSVIGPEGAAAILWRDAGRAREAAEALRITAHDLLELGVVDQIAPGPPDPGTLADVVAAALDETARSDGPARRARWRNR